MNQLEERAFRQGFEAFVDGRSIHFNPYRNLLSKQAHQNYEQWKKGWYAAKNAK
ncbi:hypothetical protein [Photobacterium leiognathi]|uniref:hypothetical protein n=1 Tax=Photobacterium leiognathi TaxID=553611 RepID=UPI002980D965|nr:hypothetical protein [Photobacterium leiognathi]